MGDATRWRSSPATRWAAGMRGKARLNPNSRLANAAGVALGVLLVAGFGLSRVLADPAATAPTCADPESWVHGDAFIGQQAAIEGPVADATYARNVGGRPTFLNLGNPYPDPDRFDVVVYADVREQFTDPPEELFVGEEVCVVGHVRQRDGVAQVVLDSALSITTVDGP